MRALTQNLVLIASLCAAGTAGATPLITNGGFDGNANGWTLSSNCNDAVYQSNGVVRLNSCGEASSDPTAAQTVNGLVVGHTYQLSWDQALHSIYSGYGYGKTFGVFLGPDGGNPLFTDETGYDWQTMSTTFVATTASQLITFAAELDQRTTGVQLRTDVSYYLDNVALVDVTPAKVPEPASLALIGLGLAGLAARRRRG